MRSLIFIPVMILAFGNELFAQDTTHLLPTKKATDSMIFLTYTVHKLNNTDYKIDHKKNSITSGRIKGFHEHKDLNIAKNLACKLLNHKFQVIETLYIQNPLEKVIEFVNDSGNLEKRLVTLDSADVSFRMPYKQDIKYVQIEFISNTNTSKYSILKL